MFDPLKLYNNLPNVPPDTPLETQAVLRKAVKAGRVLNILYLVMMGLLDLPVLYHSKYIIENKSTYYELLRDVTERARWEQWILFMLDAVEQTAVFTGDIIGVIYL